MILATVLALVGVSCGADTVATGGELLPTPVPAPTVAGQVIELPEQEVQAEVVLIGLSSTDSVDLRALPGLDQPSAGDVPPGTSIEPLGNAFETEDGLVWWQVRAGSINGWIQPNVAYRGVTQNVTEQMLSALGPDATFGSAEEAALAVAAMLAGDQGDAEIIVVSMTEIENPPSATVTVDILGGLDDSISGTRLIVASAAATGWQPASVIQAPLCSQGVSPEGACL